MSIGGPTFQPLDDICESATAAGMTIVVAASNYGVDASTYSPARARGVITVAAIDRADTRPSWSNYGKSVSLFAPGVDINSAWLTSDKAYASMSGTSMGMYSVVVPAVSLRRKISFTNMVLVDSAAPHVAGLVTYIMSRQGISGPAALKQRLVELATNGLVQNGNGSPNLIAFNGGNNLLSY